MRLDLQLFALNTKQSVVDYLKSQGQDSSMAARKELAKSLGISNYSGSYEQNVAMLNALKGGSSAQPKASNSNKGSNAPKNSNVAGSANSNISGVDQGTLDKMNSTFKASDGTNNAKSEANSYLENVKQLGSVTDIVDQSTWDAINKQWQAPTAYNEAMDYTNKLLQQLSSGRTSYTDQIKDMMDKIQNRESFEYDVDSDMLFQQYLASSMASGKTAMQDTIGQASALTGGYGSTYATSAGNQQYNAYIQDAYNNLPEYYGLALEAYQMEGEEMYNQLSMLNQADATEYQRLYDSWQANFSNAQQMYQNAYGEWRDSVGNAINSAGLQLQEYGQLYDQAYKTYSAVADHAQTMYQNEYNEWADMVNNAFKTAQMSNSDYWSTQNFIEEQRQHNEDMSYKKQALDQENAQFIAKNDLNGDGKVDNKDIELSNEWSKLGDDGTTIYENGNLADDFSFNTTEINAIKKAYRDAGGGERGYEAVDSYLKGIGKYQENEGFQMMIDSYINSAEAQEGLPAWYQTWSLTDDTKNWFGGDDNNDMYTNLNNESMTYKELKKALKNSSLSDEEIEAFMKSLPQSKR